MGSYRKAEVKDGFRFELESPLDLDQMTPVQRRAWSQAQEAAEALNDAFPIFTFSPPRKAEEIQVRAGNMSRRIYDELSQTPAAMLTASPEVIAHLPAIVADLAEMVHDLASAVVPAITWHAKYGPPNPLQEDR